MKLEINKKCVRDKENDRVTQEPEGLRDTP